MKQEARAGGQCSKVHKVLFSEGVADYNPLPVHDGVAKHAALLFNRGGAVKACGNQDGNFRVWRTGTELLQKNGQRNFARDGPGMVAGDQDDIPLSLGQLWQGGSPDGMGQGLPHDGVLRLVRGRIVHAGDQHRLQMGFLYMQWEGSPAIGDLNFLHFSTPFST